MTLGATCTGVKVISLLMVHPSHRDDPVILDKCCYCLANLAVDNVENVKDIIAGGALKSVITCMQKFRDHADLLDSGTVVLSNLCAGGDNQRVAIAKAGAVPALVSTILFEHENAQVLHDCLRAMGNLALQQDTISYILEADSVPALVKTVKDKQAEAGVLTLSISVLGNLSAFCSAEQTELVIEQGALDAMVQSSKAHPKDVKIQVCGCSWSVGGCGSLACLLPRARSSAA